MAGYLFLGGLAGASSVLAGFAQAAGNHELAQASKIAAAGAIGLSGVALVADLGRPERFLNMLRVFKPTSPMSVGSWLLSAFGGASGGRGRLRGDRSAAEGRRRRHRRRGRSWARPSARTPPRCSATPRCPPGTTAHREMPYLFAGSAASAAGGLGMMAVPAEDAGQAIRFAVLGAATELTAKSLLLRRLGETAEPYQAGRPGKLMEAAEVLTAAGLAGAVLARPEPGRDRRCPARRWSRPPR